MCIKMVKKIKTFKNTKCCCRISGTCGMWVWWHLLW